MQSHDQDELRKQAQRVLSRRISTDSNGKGVPTQEPERPRQRERPPQRERKDDQPRSREPRQRDFTVIEAAEPRVLETVDPQPGHDQEPMARTERRPIASSDTAPQVERSAYDIRTPQHGEIYNLLHSRASLRRALIVNEVLGRPKALRESSDPENFGGR